MASMRSELGADVNADSVELRLADMSHNTI